MRRGICVPMIILSQVLAGCGTQTQEEEQQDIRLAYQEMAGCEMEAVVTCDQEGAQWQATLSCAYVPDGESRVEVLAPENLAGVRAVVGQDGWSLEYEELCLDAGPLSQEEISPALCLPRLMSALREGWVLEENQEKWQEIPCVRLALDQTGKGEGKIVSTIWLRQEDGLPLRGEIAVEGEIILTAEFTSFSFCDTIDETTNQEGD